MRRNLLVVAACLLLLAANCSRQRDDADWTVMVYLNGDNELDHFAMCDFHEMASVGGSRDVNIVVQFDRPGHEVTGANWSQTLRFLVRKEMPATVANAFIDLGEQDMASGATLESFVRSSMNAFPAQHYALVMWGHGSGFRYDLLLKSMQPGTPAGDVCNIYATQSVTPFKGGTNDSSNANGVKQLLYMRELADALRRALGGRRLDVLVFDECVMGMIENAYALRESVDFMVASEEMVPWDGFDYHDWLQSLVAAHRMSPQVLAQTLVESYGRTYAKTFDCRTMSAVDLRDTQTLGSAVSRLAAAMRRNLPQELATIVAARRDCVIYGSPDCFGNGCYYHIDIQQFCEQLIKRSASREIREVARAAIISLRRSIPSSVAGQSTQKTKGSHGLAIYFPPDGNSYCRDSANECGYERYNQSFPLDFVQEQLWGDFLHDYFKLVPDINNPQVGPVSPCKNAVTGCRSPS